MAITGYVTTNRFVSAVTERVVETLVIQARSYASLTGKHMISSAQPDVLMLNSLCSKFADDNSEVYWAGIVNSQGTFVAHTDIRKVVSGQQAWMDQSSDSVSSLRPGETLRIGRDTLTITIPVEEQGVKLGFLRVASSGNSIAEARRNSIMAMGTITILMMLVGIPLTLFTVSRRLKPFGTIIDSLKTVQLNNPAINIPISSGNEFGYLADTLRAMGVRLVEAQQQLVEQQRMARELEIAREIQASILPKSFPTADLFQFAGTYRSAKEVGGDYFDFIELDQNRLGFLVADVSGKSLPGMLVMLMTRDIVMKHARTSVQPAQVLSAVNRELLSSIRKGMFVTMFYGLLDTRTGHVSFASAGHNPLIVIEGEAGNVRQIKTKGFPLGMMPDDTFQKRIEESSLTLRPGDWLLQYTDGINEAMNSERKEFGMDRLVDSLRGGDKNSPESLMAQLLERHAAFVGAAEQYDDITLMTMKWTGKSADIHKRVSEQVVNAHFVTT